MADLTTYPSRRNSKNFIACVYFGVNVFTKHSIVQEKFYNHINFVVVEFTNKLYGALENEL